MTEIDIGYGYGYIIESGRVVDQSGGCQNTPDELLVFEYENKITNQLRELYGCSGSADRGVIRRICNDREVTKLKIDNF